MAQGDFPKIVWGDSFEHTITFGAPLDGPSSWPEPRQGSRRVVAPSGEEDAWRTGTERFLEGEVRHVPPSDETSPYVATGWNTSPNGWRFFLPWARDSNAFRFFPDKGSGTFILSYLVEPRGRTEVEQTSLYRRFVLKIRSADGSTYPGF